MQTDYKGKKHKRSGMLLFPFCVLLALFSYSCNSPKRVLATETATPLATTSPTNTVIFMTKAFTLSSTPTGTLTPSPSSVPPLIKTAKPTSSPTSSHLPTKTPHESPGLIVTLGGKGVGQGYPGIPVFSPDGQLVALASRKIRIWDLHSYQLKYELSNPYPDKCYLSNASFSPDGNLFAVSITYCGLVSDPIGHLVVSDVKTGDLLRDWTQTYATMVDPNQAPYSIPVDAMAFLPNSTKLAFASGSTVEIRDVFQDENPIVFFLGKDMYASEISIRDDSEFLYVLMVWEKLNDFPANYETKFGVQIWGLNTVDLRLELEFPETDFPNEGMKLRGVNLLHYNYLNATAELRNLSTDETRSFLYRRGWQFLSADLNYLACARYFGFDEEQRSIEIWNADTWRNLYTFKPYFLSGLGSGLGSISFSNDNTILAITYQERLSLWDIQPFIQK